MAMPRVTQSVLVEANNLSTDWGGSHYGTYTAHLSDQLATASYFPSQLAPKSARSMRLRGGGLHEQKGVGAGEIVVIPHALSSELCDDLLIKANELHVDPTFEKLKTLHTQPDKLRRLFQLGATGNLYRRSVQETSKILASRGIHNMSIHAWHTQYVHAMSGKHPSRVAKRRTVVTRAGFLTRVLTALGTSGALTPEDTMRKLVNEAGGLTRGVTGARAGADASTAVVGALLEVSDTRYDHAAMGVLVGGWDQPGP